MIRNYLKVALRVVQRHRVQTFINAAGLAIGMACCLLLLLYVQHERSYDRFHEKTDRIFRLTRESAFSNETLRHANTASAPGPALSREFSSVERVARLMPSYPRRLLVSRGDQRFYEDAFFWADSSVFEIFTFPLKRGDPQTALTQPFTVVLTEAAARRYFGDEDPLGQTLTVHGWTTQDYTVTGILDDVPSASHLQLDFLASLVGEESLYSSLYAGEGQWSNSLFYTYLLLSDAAAAEALEPQLGAFAERHMGAYAASRGFRPSFHLQSLPSIHLHSDLRAEITPGGSLRYVYLFSLIAGLTLLIACINFMNLATARAGDRAREVGMRKVLGATRKQLVHRFFAESTVLTLAASVMAVALVNLLLPVFNQLAGRTILLEDTLGPFALGLLGMTVIVALVAGSYPALYLSAFRPAHVLKGAFRSGPKGVWLRQGLVVFQFAISIVLIAGTAVIISQLNYARTTDLGFEDEQVVVLPIRDLSLLNNIEAIKTALSEHPGVLNVSAAAGVPGNLMLVDRFTVVPAGAPETTQRQMYVFGTDHNYLDVLGLTLTQGRWFAREHPTDETAAFVINETAARALDWDDPVGKELYLKEGDGKRGTVIGVVRDFHYQSLHEPIAPAIFHLWPERVRGLAVKVQAGDLPGALAFLEAKWQTYDLEHPFAYSFLDEDFGHQYRAEERLGRIFGVSSALTIVIACLGLFGLAAFAAEARTKEIGIRKVLGASVAGLIALLSKDFLKLVGLAFIVGAPVAYFAAARWLDNFAYHVDLGVGIFALAGGLAFAIALVTVSYQAVKAALADPVKSLRYE